MRVLDQTIAQINDALGSRSHGTLVGNNDHRDTEFSANLQASAAAWRSLKVADAIAPMRAKELAAVEAGLAVAERLKTPTGARNQTSIQR